MQRWLPVVYFFVAVALVIAILPSTLRPPPQQPPSSAEFAPDAPPDSTNALVASLSRGGTATAGAGAGVQLAGAATPLNAVTTTTAPKRVGKPAKGGCFGNPPRQIESLYAGPCVPQFEGDNGGATYTNVSRDLLKIGLYHPTDNCDGYAPTQPSDNESSGARTTRVLQAYFNAKAETYGREIRLFCMKGGESDTAMHDNAVTAMAENLFVSYYTSLGYCREMVRLKMPVLCDPPPRDELLAGDPYMWSFQMDRTSMEEFGAEWVCKQLKDKPALFAGASSGYRTQTRSFGIISEDTTETGIKVDTQQAALRRECGIDVTDPVVYGTSFDTQNVEAGLLKLKSAGVTSVVLNIKFLNTIQTFNSADSINYYPEWLIFSPWGLDVNIIGMLMSQTQMSQVMGLSGYEWPRATPATECYRAYKTIDPNNTPDALTCGVLWDALVQMMNGITGAGPNLNPDTFKQGMYKLGHRYYEDIPYAVGGGYGPGDHSYIDNVALIWWDTKAQKPDGSPGAYRWVRCGTRYKKGEIPREDPLLFSEGTAFPGQNGCPQ